MAQTTHGENFKKPFPGPPVAHFHIHGERSLNGFWRLRTNRGNISPDLEELERTGIVNHRDLSLGLANATL